MSDSLPPLQVPTLLRQYGLRPDKSLGQNFLIDETALRKISTAAEIQVDDLVLEIGPGLGSLTRHLATAARRVIAVELDEKIIPPLKHVLEPFPHVQIIQGDILAQNPSTLLPESGYLVVANIPYYITSAVIRHLLETDNKPRRIVLTVQEEVARRICEAPPKMSLLALSVQVYGQPSLVARIPAGAFYPAPKVDSAVVRIDLYDQPQIPVCRGAKARYATRDSLAGTGEKLLAAECTSAENRSLFPVSLRSP